LTSFQFHISVKSYRISNKTLAMYYHQLLNTPGTERMLLLQISSSYF